MKKFKWSDFVKKNVFRKIGWVFLVLGVLGLIPYIYSLSVLATVKEAQDSFMAIFNNYSLYQKIVVIIPLVLRIALYTWQVVISVSLIRKNKYNKQILYYIYGLILIDVISFLLFLPFKQILYMELIMAGVTYWILIKQENSLSKFIKNEK